MMSRRVITGTLLYCIFVSVRQVDGFWDTEVSPDNVCSVPFGGGYISVWQHANEKGRYYAQPLVYLIPGTAKTKHNILTDKVEMTFDIIMWSEEAQKGVFWYIKTHVNSSARSKAIGLLPMEKIRIVWKSKTTPIAKDFQLVDHWQSNTHLPRLVPFKFQCVNAEKCNRLVDAMKTSPSTFQSLELEYIINGQRTARRVITVLAEHVTKGKLFTQLSNMQAEGNTRYLNSEDVKTIVSESATNVLATVLTSGKYVDTGDEIQLKDLLFRELNQQEISIEKFEPHMWNSVFWDREWARPDKLTHFLNTKFTSNSSSSEDFYISESERTGSNSGEAGGCYLGFCAGGKGSTSSSKKDKIEKKKLLAILQQRFDYIEWTGEVFKIKPMKLTRLNLSQLRRRTNLVTSNIQVRNYEAVHTIMVRVSATTNSQTVFLAPEKVQAQVLKLQLDFENTIRALKLEVQGVEPMLERAVKHFDGAIAHQTTFIKQLILKTRATNNKKISQIQGLTGWLSGRYCIWANGKCPSGFSRNDGHMRAVNQYSHTASYMKQSPFGSSKIACHGRCGQTGNWVGDLHIVTCCK